MIAIVIPVFNRCAITIQCMENLEALGLLAKCRVVIVDDGSTDGTEEAILSRWPDTCILKGDGNLWWGGGMKLGMEMAMKNSDFIVWLNDDCRPRKGTIESLVAYATKNHCITVGQSVTEKGLVYGGKIKTWKGLKDVVFHGEGVLKVDAFGGNCVVFPKAIVKTLGPISAETLPHFFTDADYGLRATEAGIHCYVLGEAWCDNDHNDTPAFQRWTQTPLSFTQIYQTTKLPKSWMYWPASSAFYTRHWGIFGLGMASWPYIKLYAFWLLSSLFGKQNLLRVRSAFKLGGSKQLQ